MFFFEIIVQLPLIINHFKEKAHFKKVKEGDKKYKQCFKGKELNSFLVEHYKYNKEESVVICQEIQDEGYIFEIKTDDQRFLLDHQYCITTNSIKCTLLNSKKLQTNLMKLMEENLFLVELLMHLNEELGSKSLLKCIANYLESKNLTQKFLKKVYWTSHFKKKKKI